MLEILCRKRSSKPEPISVVICRKLVVILFVSITLTVLVILSIGVKNDTPTITRKYSSKDKFPVPVVIIEFKYQFKIECYHFKTTIGTSCNEYVQQPTYDNSSYSWEGNFSQDNLSFIDDNSTISDQLILDFELTDPNYNYTNTSFSISMHDQEYDAYNDPLASGTDNYSIFVKSLQEYVYCNPGSRHILGLSRKQRTMLKDSPLNDLGLPQKYPNQTYIVINDHFYGTTGNTSFTALTIFPQNFLLETEIEQRNKNALSVISNVLAVWGGLTALYIFLFGADSIKPWGFIQERILKNETRNKLMSAPFFKKEGTPEERIEALETFLKDYVIDVGLIDQSNKSPYKKINPSS